MGGGPGVGLDPAAGTIWRTMHADQAIQRLETLRAREARRGGGTDLRDRFASLARELARAARRSGTAGEAWLAVCPEEFVDRTRVVGLARGVLTLGVADAATHFELDQFLRGGGREVLVRASTAPIRRIKVVVDPSIDARSAGGVR